MEKKITFKYDDIRLEMNIRLTETKSGEALGISGMVYRKNKRGRWMEIGGGQCLDDEYFKEASKRSALVRKVVELWERYHLNDMHAGTEKQEDFLEKHFKDNPNERGYKASCDALDKAGLLVDDGYKYGTNWLFRPIPEKALDDIHLILETDDNDKLEKIFASR